MIVNVISITFNSVVSLFEEIQIIVIDVKVSKLVQ